MYSHVISHDVIPDLHNLVSYLPHLPAMSTEPGALDPELAKQIAQSQDAQMQAETEDAAHARLQAQFANDPRIHFSKESETWQYEADDGKEMEWDPVKGVWVEIVDEEMLKAQQAAYAVAGVDEEVSRILAVIVI